MTQPAWPARVVKLGGSLLTTAELRERFDGWVARQSPARTILVVGGGELVEAIRQINRVHRLDSTSTHWLAVRAMKITARLAAELLERPLETKYESLAGHREEVVVFDVWTFLESMEPQLDGVQLPSNWDVTSDSIAARVAQATSAVELVLLKSKLPNRGATIVEAARSGYVDAHFPRAAKGLARVRFVDLSRSDLEEVELPT